MTEHQAGKQEQEEAGLKEILVSIVDNWKLLVAGPVLLACVGFAATYAITPKYTGRAVIFPPQQQQQSATAAAMQSIGAIAGLAGTTASLRNPADQYISLMQSVTVSDRIVQMFKLAQVYKTETPGQARDVLSSNVNLIASRKDGLIVIDVDDTDPKRAAAIANGYINQLKRLTAEFALTEAQQRRVFFERQLHQTNERLTAAQRELQVSGINEGALRADPKAAAESFASLRAQITVNEMKLRSMQGYLTPSAPEYKSVLANLDALKVQLSKVESPEPSSGGANYIEKYREYRYQETLFEMFAKQFELARLDESREGALIQVVDYATPPERKSKPKRLQIAFGVLIVSEIMLLAYVAIRNVWRSEGRKQ